MMTAMVMMHPQFRCCNDEIRRRTQPVATLNLSTVIAVFHFTTELCDAELAILSQFALNQT